MLYRLAIHAVAIKSGSAALKFTWMHGFLFQWKSLQTIAVSLHSLIALNLPRCVCLDAPDF